MFLYPDSHLEQMGLYQRYDEELYGSHKSSYPKVVLYGKHLYHCMHILLYGTMDFVQMYNDLEWQSSSEFLKAGEHANFCGKVGSMIILAPQSALTRLRITDCWIYTGD